MRWCAGAFALVLAAGVVACHDDPPPYLVDLGGEHRFRHGDDPEFAAPDFDDTGWDAVGLPAAWREQTVGVAVFGWHRFRFEVPDPAPSSRLALDVGAIGWSDQVFLNGRRIGATGRFDRLPRLGPWPRLYSVPDGALQPGTNVLAIRVRGIPLGACGLFATRIGIGDELALARARTRALSRTQIAEGLLFGFLGLSWLLVVFFPKRGRQGRATLFLLVAITAAMVLLWLLSSTARENGSNPDVPAPVVIALLIVAASAYGAFVATIARGHVPRLLKLLTAAGAPMVVLLLAFPGAFAVLIVVSAIVGQVGGAVVLWLLVGAVRARTPGAIPLVVACALPTASVLAMFVLRIPFLVGLPLIYYGLVSAIALAVLALTRHVHDMNHQMQRATKYALDAHTQERGRLARDLHDGLGQMLALLKLQMQRMGRKHEGEPVQRAFDESAEQVAATIDELRRIARDLRPAPMEDRGLGEAVREYAAAMSQRTDIEVLVEGDYQGPVSEGVGDELYRIAQECLTNCLKHSGARHVVVTLAEVGDRYSLAVADDGRGLPAEVPQGLGLATIRERSELLGGSCTITQTSGGGMRVEVSVPRDRATT